MKILFVLENFYPKIGGVETLFYQLTLSLAKKGNEVIVLTNKGNYDLPKKEYLHPNLCINRVQFYNRYLFTFLGFISAIKYAKSVDIIHTTSYNAGIPAFIAGKICNKKVIITFHELWGKLWYKLPFFSSFSLRLHYWFEQLLISFPFHKFIAVSDYTKHALLNAGINPEKITRIYNGLDYSEYENLSKPKEEFTFLYYGRIGISKGLDLLIPAFALSQDPHSTLALIVPKQPNSLLQKILGLIKKHHVEKRVTIFHELSFDDLKSKICSSKSIIIPSYSEGFCFVAAESVALNKPIISSGRGALKEVVSGKYIEMDDQTIIALKNALDKAIKNEWTLSSKKYFKLDDSIDEYLKLYSSIL